MLRRLRGWIRALVRPAVVEREMLDEMEYHREQVVERLMARGISRAQATADARREFGHIASIQEQARDARGVRWIQDAVQDLRYALRGVRRRPGFTLGVVATLGLGVGANASVFAIVDRLLFRPPAYLVAPASTHHLYFTRMVREAQTIGESFAYQRYRDIAQSTTTMDVVAAYFARRLSVGSGDEESERLVGVGSASFWNLFSAHPAVGRFFTADEDRPGAPRVAVLSNGFWQSRYGGSPNVIGRTIEIAPERYQIIGVAPERFVGVERETPSVFIPIEAAAADEFGQRWHQERADYSTSFLRLYARRRPDVSLATATSELSSALLTSYRRQAERDPSDAPMIEKLKPSMLVTPVLAERGPRPSADARVAAWLLGVTIIVLVIACANVGNLLLTRAIARRREIGVRLALGVNRSRLARQLLMESAILATLGALAGVLLAQWGGGLLHRFLTPDVEQQSIITDPRTLLFTAIATAIVALCSSIPPILQMTTRDAATVFRGETASGSNPRSRLRSGLALAQVAMSVVLLVGAGLFVRSMDRVTHVRLGFDSDHLLAVAVRLRSVKLDSASEETLRRALIERALANPNVRGATFACSIPFWGTCAPPIVVAGVDSVNRFGEFVRQIASPGYFETVGTRILQGRGLLASDDANGPRVAVVSAAMAKAVWPGANPIGKCFRVRSQTSPCLEVVGVAENVRQDQFADEAGLEYYVPSAQSERTARLMIRMNGDATTQAELVRRDLMGVMPPSTYLVVQPLAGLVGDVTRSWRLGAVMFAAFGALALVVAAIGLYSIVSHGVAQRTRELGVRMALGAGALNVVTLVVTDALRVVIAGLVAGVALALLGGRWIAGLLFHVSPRDGAVFVSAMVTLLGVAILASLVPAIRATRVDPSITLRAD